MSFEIREAVQYYQKRAVSYGHAVKHFHHYLLGQMFTVRTDHGSSQWLNRFENCEGQVPSWVETLSAYVFIVIHRTGRVHSNADSMSRRSCHSDHCKYCDRYQRRYSPDTIADLTKIAGESGAVKRIASKEGETGDGREVTLPYIGSGNDVVTLMMGATIVSLCLVIVASRRT